MESRDTLELGLQIGDALLMQPLFGAAGQRYRSHLIGAASGASLTVRPPEGGAGPLAVKEGERFAIRAFVGDRAIAFTCSVLRVCSQPYPYLHLTFPQRLESVVVRHAKRLDLEQPATLALASAPGASTAVSLVNLSISGAMVAGPPDVAQLGEAVALATEFRFQGLAEQPITLAAVVRNIKDEQNDGASRRCYGLEFRDLPLTSEIALRAFVFERIVSSTRL